MNENFSRLHLGCGDKHIAGFVHIDVADAEHIDYRHDIRTLPMVPDDSAELVYCSHVLEHFGRWEIAAILKEWYRVTAPNGVLRLAVPDFAACASIYYEQGLEDGLSGLIGLICGGQRDEYDMHKMIFDEPYLTNLLMEAGFSSVQPWDWRETEHRDLDDYSQAYLPHLDKETGRLMSLNIEAVK